MEKEEDDEDLQDLFDWIDMQPWSDEDLQLSKKGGLTEEEKEQCRKLCCKDSKQNGLPYGDMELRRPAR